MSALGQKQTCAAHKPMSAKCQEQTFAAGLSMWALCQTQVWLATDEGKEATMFESTSFSRFGETGHA